MRDGSRPPDTADKSIGDIVGEVSEKASLLVREEIELAIEEAKRTRQALERQSIERDQLERGLERESA